MWQDPPRIGITVEAGATGLVQAVRRLDDAGIGIADATVRRPSLDDVFLSITGHGAEAELDRHEQEADA